jgi:UDP-N-acetylmuramoylalanine--D-glutamate ligase
MSLPKSYVPKSASIIGAARSGIGAARFLSAKGVSVFISDTCPQETLEKILSQNGLSDLRHEAGGHTDALLSSEVIILSPGVPSDLPILKKARTNNIPVWSEIELAYRFTDATWMAITGSTGKSTTVSLLGSIMEASAAKYVVAGNIGVPLVGAVNTLSHSGFVVAEISSFQLENIDLFKPHVAVVINLLKNHLDRYENEEAYYNAKKEIARNLSPDDFLILNGKDARLRVWAQEFAGKATIAYFGTREPETGHNCAFCENGILYTQFGGVIEAVVDVNKMKISGPHNQDNACAAAVAAKSVGLPTAAIASGVISFAGLAHRLEYIAEVNGIRYFNDSKATTAEAVLCAVTAFGRNVHLIAGGRDKGCDFSIINEAVKTHARGVYLIGEAAGRIAAVWNGLAPLIMCDSLESAVVRARDNARPGDVVVLSPGCSSFDMFADYEVRGEAFRDIVLRFAKDKGQ